jgi:hypothetical protein
VSFIWSTPSSEPGRTAVVGCESVAAHRHIRPQRSRHGETALVPSTTSGTRAAAFAASCRTASIAGTKPIGGDVSWSSMSIQSHRCSSARSTARISAALVPPVVRIMLEPSITRQCRDGLGWSCGVVEEKNACEINFGKVARGFHATRDQLHTVRNIMLRLVERDCGNNARRDDRVQRFISQDDRIPNASVGTEQRGVTGGLLLPSNPARGRAGDVRRGGRALLQGRHSCRPGCLGRW